MAKLSEKLRSIKTLAVGAEDIVQDITMGTEFCVIYPANGEPFRQVGMRNMTRKPSQEDTVLYADDDSYIVIPGAKTVEGELKYYKLVPQFWELLGWYTEENGGQSDSDNKKQFSVAHVQQVRDAAGNVTPLLVVDYGLLGTDPERDENTTEDKVDGEELTVPYTASGMADILSGNGRKMTRYTRKMTGYTFPEVYALMMEGLPRPDDEFTIVAQLNPTTTTATFTIGDTALTDENLITLFGVTAIPDTAVITVDQSAVVYDTVGTYNVIFSTPGATDVTCQLTVQEA